MSAEPETTQESLGTRIKRLRQLRGFSQDRLAIESEIDQSGLSKFERGKDRSMGEASLRRIANNLQVSFEELIEGTDYRR
jgi:transcriptional regulator with XRE-family HTH domain